MRANLQIDPRPTVIGKSLSCRVKDPTTIGTSLCPPALIGSIAGSVGHERRTTPEFESKHCMRLDLIGAQVILP